PPTSSRGSSAGRGPREMTAVGLACLSALLFGGMSVGLRMGLARVPHIEVGTLAVVATALVVALVCAAAEVPVRGVHAGAAWPFLLAGMLSPGGAQLFVTLAVRDAGASRSEEHTSELQSLRHLVCRLLLEKKKKNQIRTDTRY